MSSFCEWISKAFFTSINFGERTLNRYFVVIDGYETYHDLQSIYLLGMFVVSFVQMLAKIVTLKVLPTVFKPYQINVIVT